MRAGCWRLRQGGLLYIVLGAASNRGTYLDSRSVLLVCLHARCPRRPLCWPPPAVIEAGSLLCVVRSGHLQVALVLREAVRSCPCMRRHIGGG